MVSNPVFLATNAMGVTRAELRGDGVWTVETSLDGKRVNSLASDPRAPGRVFAGTQTDGLWRSDDAGRTWQRAGLSGKSVKSIAVSPLVSGLMYAGCKPLALFVSADDGGAWNELPALRLARKWWWFSPAEPPDWGPYPQALTLSPADPNVILAGIELGGVLRSTDGGRTWSGHQPGAVLDCHSLIFHASDGSRVYGGGGSGCGAAQSLDGGLTWRQMRAGLGAKYGWMVAADAIRPDVWYLSASDLPNPLKGQFVPPAHVDGSARGRIYRSIGDGPWERLSGGLPEPLDFMAYALVADPGTSGRLYAGLANGDVWKTDYFWPDLDETPDQSGWDSPDDDPRLVHAGVIQGPVFNKQTSAPRFGIHWRYACIPNRVDQRRD